jgi:hypothetical protein
MGELRKAGEMQKKMDAEKFYVVYYQMTELIPLFSYLERLNCLKYTVTNFDGGSTPTETAGR